MYLEELLRLSVCIGTGLGDLAERGRRLRLLLLELRNAAAWRRLAQLGRLALAGSARTSALRD